MFWKKKKAKVPSQVGATAPISTIAVEVCHLKYSNLDLRRAILEWRDDHIENVETHLNRQINGLYRSLDQQLEKMSMRDLFDQRSYGKRNIEPIFEEWLTHEIMQLSDVAQEDLSKIFVHAWEFGKHGGALDQQSDNELYTDAALAVAATGAGVAAIPAVAVVSVVSAGGIAGFLGVTTIALPIVTVGVATVGTLLALGGYRAASLKSRAIARYRKGVVESIERRIFGQKNDEDSICRLLQLYIQQTADKIITEIDQC